jgi:hypothetical protein
MGLGHYPASSKAAWQRLRRRRFDMEKSEPSFDPYRDLNRREQRTCTYQPGEWQGQFGERSPYARIAIRSSEAEMDWTNDPHLDRDYFGGGAVFSWPAERPRFQLEASSMEDVPDFHRYMNAAAVRRTWIDFCLELDVEVVDFIPIDAVLADGPSTSEQLYVWDVVREIDAIDWGRTKSIVINGELNGADYVYNRRLGSITLRPDIPQQFDLFRDNIDRTTAFRTRLFEHEAAHQGLKGFAMGDLLNYPHTGREYHQSHSDSDEPPSGPSKAEILPARAPGTNEV